MWFRIRGAPSGSLTDMSVFLALLSSVIWGTADFLGGTLSRKRKPLAVIGASQTFGFVSAALIAIAMHQWGFAPGVVRNGVIAGVVGLAGLVAFYAALASGRMGIVSPLASIGVSVPVALGLAHGDRPTHIQLVGIAVAIVGVVLASGPELSGGADPKPVILALSSGMTFGLCTYFMALGGRINPSMTIVTMRITQMCVALLALIIVRSFGGLVRRDIPMLIAIGSTDAIANVLFAVSVKIGMLTVVSVLGALFPVVTVLLAWIVHDERLAKIQYLGIAVTLAGVAAISAG